MLSRTLTRAFFIAVALVASGCSSSSPSPAKADAGAGDAGGAAAARPKTKPKTATLKAKAGPKPPAGATSKGAQTQPKVGALQVPITDVEVFTYQEVFADNGAPETINWAYVEGKGTYLWAGGAVTCADGTTDANAGFLMGIAPDGTGTYLFSLPGCPAGDFFGCDFDDAGNDTACGACAVADGAITCAVSP